MDRSQRSVDEWITPRIFLQRLTARTGIQWSIHTVYRWIASGQVVAGGWQLKKSIRADQVDAIIAKIESKTLPKTEDEWIDPTTFLKRLNDETGMIWGRMTPYRWMKAGKIVAMKWSGKRLIRADQVGMIVGKLKDGRL